MPFIFPLLSFAVGLWALPLTQTSRSKFTLRLEALFIIKQNMVQQTPIESGTFTKIISQTILTHTWLFLVTWKHSYNLKLALVTKCAMHHRCSETNITTTKSHSCCNIKSQHVLWAISYLQRDWWHGKQVNLKIFLYLENY